MMKVNMSTWCNSPTQTVAASIKSESRQNNMSDHTRSDLSRQMKNKFWRGMIDVTFFNGPPSISTHLPTDQSHAFATTSIASAIIYIPMGKYQKKIVTSGWGKRGQSKKYFDPDHLMRRAWEVRIEAQADCQLVSSPEAVCQLDFIWGETNWQISQNQLANGRKNKGVRKNFVAENKGRICQLANWLPQYE